jgi:hypothetical protein
VEEVARDFEFWAHHHPVIVGHHLSCLFEI